MSSTYPSAPPPGGPGAVSGNDTRSFFGALFDFSLRSYVTTRFLRILYVVVTVLIVLGYVVAVISALTQSVGQFLGVLVIGALVALLYLIIARIYVEVISVLFRINDNTARMAEALAGWSGPPSGGGPGWVPSGGPGPAAPPPPPPSTPPYPGTGSTPPGGPLGPQSPWSSGGSSAAGPGEPPR